MSKKRLIFACLSMAILLTMVLMACAPAAPAKPATPPAATPPPATKTYTNAEYGFSFNYPSSMIAAPPKAKYAVFEAADAMQVPAVGASVLDTAKVAEQTEESIKSSGGSDIKTVSTDPITMADGKTKGTFTILSWKSSGYNITTYSAAIEKGDKTLSVSYTSLTDMIDAKIAKEVVLTLTLK